MTVPAWFLPPVEAAKRYAKQLADMRFAERLAKACGREIRPRKQ